MTDLIIHLPTINENWVEQHTYQLLADGIEFLERSDPKSMELSIGCLGFEDAWNEITIGMHDNFYRKYNRHVSEAEKVSEDHVKLIFIGHNLWDRTVVTKEDVDNFNEALKEIVFQIADNYARAWAKELGLTMAGDLEWNHE